MRRADIRLRCQDESALEYDQDIRAHRPERAWQEQADVPQAATRRERHAANLQGVLHPRAVELDSLFANKVVCCVREWVRDHRPGHAGHPRLARPQR